MLLQIKNLILNTEKVTKVKYSPQLETTDDETGQPLVQAASLEITLDSVIATSREGYDGEFLGAASESERIILRGEDALSIWQVFQSQATLIYSVHQ